MRTPLDAVKLQEVPQGRTPRVRSSKLSSRWISEIHDAKECTYAHRNFVRYSMIPRGFFSAGAPSKTRSSPHSKVEERHQRSLFRSIFGSHVSRDFSVSSQVISRPVYAAVRAIMQESADSAPLSA